MPAINPAAVEFLTTRRSVPAKALAAPLPDRAQVLALLTGAARSPDHGKLEPWRFIVLQGEALIRLAHCPAARGSIFNIGSTAETTIAALAEQVIATLGSRSTVQLIPYGEAYEPGFEDMRRRKPSVEKLAAFTGFRPGISLREIIEQTAHQPG